MLLPLLLLLLPGHLPYSLPTLECAGHDGDSAHALDHCMRAGCLLLESEDLLL